MIYILISFLLDNVLSNLIGNNYQNISIFFPMILVSSIPISYVLFRNKKVMFIFLFCFGIIYDVLYSDIFLINTCYFVLYYLFLYVFYNNKKVSFVNLFIISICGFVFYDIFIFFNLLFLGIFNFKITYLFYKISHSLFTNVVYIILSLLLLKSRIFGDKIKKYNY